MDSEYVDQLRTKLWVANRWASVLARTLNGVGDDHPAAETFLRERPVMRAELYRLNEPSWWSQATPTEVGDMLELAGSWADRDDRARFAVEALRTEIYSRYQVDIDDPLEGGRYADWDARGIPDPIATDREARNAQLQHTLERGAPVSGSLALWRVRPDAAFSTAVEVTPAPTSDLPGRLIDPDNVRMHEDGHAFRRTNSMAGWCPLAEWGNNGYDLGSWPRLVVMTSDEFEHPQALLYDAGRVEVREFSTEHDRERFLDNVAESMWRSGVAAGPRDIAAYPVGKLPAAYKGAPNAAELARAALPAPKIGSRVPQAIA